MEQEANEFQKGIVEEGRTLKTASEAARELAPQQAIIGYKPTSFIEIVLASGTTPEKVATKMVEMAESFRKAAIRLTFPNDWVLFRRLDKISGKATITGYLQDAGCNRANKIWGCSTESPTLPDKRVDKGDESYTYVVYGDGFCARTGERIQTIVGSRSSTDDIVDQWRKEGFPESKIGIRLEQAARANLDGNIIRELTGLDSVPVDELKECGIDISGCAYARGFGDMGGKPIIEKIDSREVVPWATDNIPSCPTHGPMKLVPAGVSKKGKKYSAFWACKEFSCKETMHDSEWKEKVASTQTSATETASEVEFVVTKEDLINALDEIQIDSEAENVVAQDGQTLKSYISGLELKGVTKEKLEEIVLKCKEALVKYKKGIEPEQGELL